MQKSQILQEYLFMERVNAFLEEKLMTLPKIEITSKNNSKESDLDEKPENNPKNPIKRQNSQNSDSNSSGENTNDSTTYHHGRYELDTENSLDLKPLTTEQQNTISCLNQLGIDPIINVSSIKEHLEIIELQVDERRRQLDEENKSLNEKLQELIKGLGEVNQETKIKNNNNNNSNDKNSSNSPKS